MTVIQRPALREGRICPQGIILTRRSHTILAKQQFYKNFVREILMKDGDSGLKQK
ncbi:MAG TPA: hypothetical protein VG847_04530 [Chitinophagaceae bacterium]|nr:hypothetical protein [Chitinophagaceae bacterium]